jgi:hypothetical protein
VTTLRTLIVGPMCVNSPDHHAVQYGELVRVSHGQYELVSRRANFSVPEVVIDDAPADTESVGVQLGHDDEWFWEGNIQAAVVRHLAAEGWRILRVANMSTGEHGVAVEADRQGARLLVEVKGHPGTTYARVDRRGGAKPTHAATQARAYFSHALLAGLLMRADAADARIVLAFPAMPTFERLADRVVGPLTRTGIELWLVHSGGLVTQLLAK